MSANEKAAAAYHPLDDEFADALVGENPCLEPRSGARAVLNALAANDAAVKHANNLQAAVNDIRTFIEGKHTVGAIEIRNLLESHYV